MKAHIRICGTILVILLLTALLAPVKAQNNLEERVERLEAEIDSLRNLIAGRTRVIPSYETVIDSPNVQYGVACLVDTLLDKNYFFINYNCDWKVAYWVAYYLTAEDLEGTATGNKSFVVDWDLPPYARSKNGDYTNSGYQRGHLAPAAAFKRSIEARNSTFIYSNASPQHRKFNNGIWKKLERQVRDMVTEKGRAWIVTGNMFMNADSMFMCPRDWIGQAEQKRVAIPTHLFKAILAEDEEGEFKTYGFIVPHQREPNPDPTNEYRVSIDRLEQITGYDFFLLLPDDIEEDIENDRPEWRW